MYRTSIAALALVALPSIAPAQERPLPLAPGVFRGSSFGPGMPSLLNPTRPGQPQGQVVPLFVPNYWWGFGGYPYWGYPPIAPYQSWVTPLPPGEPTTPERKEPFVLPAPRPVEEPPLRAAPATLVLQLPAAGELWVDGKSRPGPASEEHILTSPVLRAGGSHTFDVKARWTEEGKTYEATRTITVAAGDRTRVIVISGTAVK